MIYFGRGGTTVAFFGRYHSHNREPLGDKRGTMSQLNWCKTSCAVFLLFATTPIALPAQTFTALFSFDYQDGGGPNGLVQATDGNLYGTTFDGGSGSNSFGTIFKVNPSGKLTTLYNFCSQTNCRDGDFTYAGLVQAINGNFYGATTNGGANDYGTLFEITPGGVLTTVYDFCPESGCTDGGTPTATLIQATDGNFYGTTNAGGANGGGTVFKITPSGKLTTLYSFCSQSGCTDGYQPFAGLLQATDGNFYGTTSFGGANGDYGTVFKITPSGALTTLYSFCSRSGCTDGGNANGLIQANDGTFYGTTVDGGTSSECADGCGTVFKITPSGSLTVLHSFCSESSCGDGEYPDAVLIQATDGNFYGTTNDGGANGDYGTVFKITPSGGFTVLYNFCSRQGCTDGTFPGFSALVQDTNGKLYGTTVEGGSSGACTGGCGTIFSLSVGLGPFVRTQPAVGKAGKAVKILGTNLTGATSVTFNGTPAAFTVESGSVIKATVPAGATTGTVQVVTPSGTLSSNVPFRVAP
jgi:uncharacterized repeat protein (TIGR03803 family)